MTQTVMWLDFVSHRLLSGNALLGLPLDLPSLD